MDDNRVNDRIDEAVLALLYLGIVERHPTGAARTCKSFDWSAMGKRCGHPTPSRGASDLRFTTAI